MVHWMKLKSSWDLDAFHVFHNCNWLLQIITEARAQKYLETDECWVVVKIFKNKTKNTKFLAFMLSQALCKKVI